MSTRYVMVWILSASICGSVDDNGFDWRSRYEEKRYKKFQDRYLVQEDSEYDIARYSDKETVFFTTTIVLPTNSPTLEPTHSKDSNYSRNVSVTSHAFREPSNHTVILNTIATFNASSHITLSDPTSSLSIILGARRASNTTYNHSMQYLHQNITQQINASMHYLHQNITQQSNASMISHDNQHPNVAPQKSPKATQSTRNRYKKTRTPKPTKMPTERQTVRGIDPHKLQLIKARRERALRGDNNPPLKHVKNVSSKLTVYYLTARHVDMKQLQERNIKIMNRYANDLIITQYIAPEDMDSIIQPTLRIRQTTTKRSRVFACLNAFWSLVQDASRRWKSELYQKWLETVVSAIRDLEDKKDIEEIIRTFNEKEPPIAKRDSSQTEFIKYLKAKCMPSKKIKSNFGITYGNLDRPLFCSMVNFVYYSSEIMIDLIYEKDIFQIVENIASKAISLKVNISYVIQFIYSESAPLVKHYMYAFGSDINTYRRIARELTSHSFPSLNWKEIHKLGADLNMCCMNLIYVQSNLKAMEIIMEMKLNPSLKKRNVIMFITGKKFGDAVIEDIFKGIVRDLSFSVEYENNDETLLQKIWSTVHAISFTMLLVIALFTINWMTIRSIK
eukprot:51057_1